MSFNRVYLRSSMSHTDGLMQRNFNQILKELPQGHRYRVTGTGKVVLKDERYDDVTHDDENNADNVRGPGRDPRQSLPRGGLRGRGRGRGRPDYVR